MQIINLWQGIREGMNGIASTHTHSLQRVQRVEFIEEMHVC